MHYRTAQEMWTAPVERKEGSAERQHIENKIREHERAIASHAQQIRWLKMELES